jgi:hypothetical protein
MALDQFNVVYVAWMLTVSVALGVFTLGSVTAYDANN